MEVDVAIQRQRLDGRQQPAQPSFVLAGQNLGLGHRHRLEAQRGADGGVPVSERAPEGRAGDQPRSWADPTKANSELGWATTRSIDDMCADTWRWQSANPTGYED